MDNFKRAGEWNDIIGAVQIDRWYKSVRIFTNKNDKTSQL